MHPKTPLKKGTVLVSVLGNRVLGSATHSSTSLSCPSGSFIDPPCVLPPTAGLRRKQKKVYPNQPTKQTTNPSPHLSALLIYGCSKHWINKLRKPLWGNLYTEQFVVYNNHHSSVYPFPHLLTQADLPPKSETTLVDTRPPNRRPTPLAGRGERGAATDKNSNLDQT